VLTNYLKTAFKVLLRRKVFTAISLFGIAFTLVVLIVAASLLDQIFGPHALEPKLDRSLGVFMARLSGENMSQNGNPGYRLLNETLRNLPGAESVALYTSADPVATYKDGERISLSLKRTDGAFWQVLNFRFLEGGPFSSQDDANGNFVAVINESTRRKLFGGAPAVGKTFELDSQTFRVVGVVPDVPFLRMVPFSDVWAPLQTAKTRQYQSQLMGGFQATIVGRTGADLPGIRAEFHRRVKATPLPDPKRYNKLECEAETMFEFVATELFGLSDGRATKLLAILTGLALLFMILPALNLVNLNVSRILERASEIGVRKAFGATSRTLVGQFLVENLLLCVLGGTIGLVLASLALRLINSTGVMPYSQLSVNLRVFFAGFTLSLVFGLVSGVYPAWKMSRLHPVEALNGGAL